MRSSFCEALKSGVVGGAAGGVISAALNYHLLPFPQTTVDNAIGHGMSGFFCGLMSGLVAVLLHTRRRRPEGTGSPTGPHAERLRDRGTAVTIANRGPS